MPELLQRVTIRPANGKDAEAIARLSGKLGYEVSAGVMEQRLGVIGASRCDLVVVAVRAKFLRQSERESNGRSEEQNGEVVGWLQAHAADILESGFRVEITGMIVSPEVRRCGVGRLLVADAEKWAREKGAGVVVVRSNAQRVESHFFYPALGFRESKKQVVYRKNF
jgi:GNAT superfamily N-acetyltransferase